MAQRDAVGGYACKAHYPILLFKRCAKCKKEFCREWGWKYQYLAGWDESPSTIYICGKCAVDGHTADKIIGSIIYR